MSTQIVLGPFQQATILGGFLQAGLFGETRVPTVGIPGFCGLILTHPPGRRLYLHILLHRMENKGSDPQTCAGSSGQHRHLCHDSGHCL